MPLERNLFVNLGVFILFPIAGFASKSLGLGASFLFLALFLAIGIVVAFIYRSTHTTLFSRKIFK